MDGNEIIRCINKIPILKPHFLGIFTIDTIPAQIEDRCFFICNLSKLKDPGTHWVAFVKPKKGVLEIFDSLSVNIDYIINFLNLHERTKLLHNETSFQKKDTSTCGKFVIYFCFHRLLNLDLNFKLLLESIFSNNKDENESRVKSFYIDVLADKTESE